jgi:hypothetical protein
MARTADHPRAPRDAPPRVTAVYVRLTARGHADQEADLRRWAAGQEGPVAWYVDRDAAAFRPRLTPYGSTVEGGRTAGLSGR